MIAADIKAYATEHWSGYLQKVSEISSNTSTELPLVDSDVCIYNFDEIAQNILKSKVGTSADGLAFSKRNIELIEFKSGFAKKISKKNFDQEEAKCDYSGVICDKYWNIFRKLRKKEKNELLDSLRLKALESYLILEKNVAPLCQGNVKDRCLTLIVVVDVDPVEEIESIYGEASGKRPEDNELESIRQSLIRFSGCVGSNGERYLYNSVQVMSVSDFMNHLKAIENQM